MTQVSETEWEVNKINQIHAIVDPQGEIIESFGEVEWKNTLEPLANMNFNHEISKSLDTNPGTFHYYDGSKEQSFIKYDTDKIDQADYFSNLFRCVNTFKGDISRYNNQKVHEKWRPNKEFKTFYTGDPKQKQLTFQYKNNFFIKGQRTTTCTTTSSSSSKSTKKKSTKKG